MSQSDAVKLFLYKVYILVTQSVSSCIPWVLPSINGSSSSVNYSSSSVNCSSSL